MSQDNKVKGRFAPSPTGRMHLGNVFSALLSWLSARSRGGKWLLRIEDLDPQRSRREHALQIEDDLRWLGLDWDEGGTEERGDNGPYCQSLRGEIYEDILRRLRATGMTYPCFCTRADLKATQAPHQSDGRVIYPGTCRPARFPAPWKEPGRSFSERIAVADSRIDFTDGVFGPQSVWLADHCGDFVLRRADGAWAYQLAVVADDALMGVTEVVRGSDLLLSAAQQIYLFRMLGYEPPRYLHVPLLCNSQGVRLSKRDKSLSLGELRQRYGSPEPVIGRLAFFAGLTETPAPVAASDLIIRFDPDRIPRSESIVAE